MEDVLRSQEATLSRISDKAIQISHRLARGPGGLNGYMLKNIIDKAVEIAIALFAIISLALGW